MFQVDNKNTRARCETCLKLKLKIITPECHCQTEFDFIVKYERISCLVLVFLLNLNDGWECYVCILTNARQMTINSLEHLKKRLCFYGSLFQYSKKSRIKRLQTAAYETLFRTKSNLRHRMVFSSGN